MNSLKKLIAIVLVSLATTNYSEASARKPRMTLEQIEARRQATLAADAAAVKNEANDNALRAQQDADWEVAYAANRAQEAAAEKSKKEMTTLSDGIAKLSIVSTKKSQTSLRENKKGLDGGERTMTPAILPTQKRRHFENRQAGDTYATFRADFAMALKGQSYVKDVINAHFGKVDRCNCSYISALCSLVIFSLCTHECCTRADKADKYEKYMIHNGTELLKQMVRCVDELDQRSNTKLTDKNEVSQAVEGLVVACGYLGTHDYDLKHSCCYSFRNFSIYLPFENEKTTFDTRLKTHFWATVRKHINTRFYKMLIA